MTDLFIQHSRSNSEGCSCCGPNSNNHEDSRNSEDTSEEHIDNMAMIAREMNELSVQERVKVLEELHGVAAAHEETPEFVNGRMEELDKCLLDLPKSSRKALDHALFFRPGILSDYKFKLMFLRATPDYDPCVSANRIAKYFEDKLMLFGEKLLAKDITLDDLDETDRKVFDMGGYLIVPKKDPTGRPIWFIDMRKLDLTNVTSMIRVSWYQVMSTLEDEVAQMKGVCNIAFCPGRIFSNPEMLAGVAALGNRTGDILTNLPCRVTSYHFCYNDPQVRAVLSSIGVALGKQIRLRLRTHFGSDLEIQYSLMTFGIKLDSLLSSSPWPSKAEESSYKEESCSQAFVLANSNISDRRRDKKHTEVQKNYTLQRLSIEKQRKEREESESAKSGIILYPNSNDVLVGRGRLYREFSGNVQWSQMVDSKLKSYHESSDKFFKTCISMEIVRTVRDLGGRFLLPDEKGWKLMDDIAAREKTSSLFRSKAAKVSSPPAVSGSNFNAKLLPSAVSNPLLFDHTFPTTEGFIGGSATKRLRYDPSFLAT